MTFAVGRIRKCTLKLKLLVFLFCSPEVGLSYHVKCADRLAPCPNLQVSANRPIVHFRDERQFPLSLLIIPSPPCRLRAASCCGCVRLPPAPVCQFHTALSPLFSRCSPSPPLSSLRFFHHHSIASVPSVCATQMTWNLPAGSAGEPSLKRKSSRSS